MYLQERRLISPKSTAKVHKGWGANTPRGGKIGVVCGISEEIGVSSGALHRGRAESRRQTVECVP